MSKTRKSCGPDFAAPGEYERWLRSQRRKRITPQPDAAPGARVNFRRITGRPELCPTSAVLHDPVSDIIGLSALINSFIGAGSVAGGVGAAVGGFVVASTLSIPASLRASLHEVAR